MQEPHYLDFSDYTHITGTGPNFEAIKPKTIQSDNQERRIRSWIWANRSIEYVQHTTDSDDITAITLQRANRSILVASVYVPCVTYNREEDKQQLVARMQDVQRIIENKKTTDPELDILVAGDFNRYDSLWGESHVALEQDKEKGPNSDFLEHNTLQVLTPRGMVTWERNEHVSTIDCYGECLPCYRKIQG